ncbi:uncharacterized protein DS421_17g588950 [Arachis hypogaea]|nr:uncharacterized protein DS421_17g588950 [Arachis hypogaea]
MLSSCAATAPPSRPARRRPPRVATTVCREERSRALRAIASCRQGKQNHEEERKNDVGRKLSYKPLTEKKLSSSPRWSRPC